MRPRAIPAEPPSLDRLALRAALATRAAWPRDGAGLAALVCAAVGRDGGIWSRRPEDVVSDWLLGEVDGSVAMPAWGVASWRPLATKLGGRVVPMPPARDRLDPGDREVHAALDRGARAVLLAPVAGDPSGVAEAASLCGARGVPLVVDARRAMGSRAGDRPVGACCDVALLSVDGEPAGHALGGAIVCGSKADGDATAGTWTGALRTMASAIAAEPRLLRYLPLPAIDVAASGRWAFAAAAARLQQSERRASQRVRLLRTLRGNVAHIAGLEPIAEATAGQSAAGWLALFSPHRNAVAATLRAAGVPAGLDGLGPISEPLPPAAADVAARALLIPVHPFYRRADLDHLCEALRGAALREAQPD